MTAIHRIAVFLSTFEGRIATLGILAGLFVMACDVLLSLRNEDRP